MAAVGYLLTLPVCKSATLPLVLAKKVVGVAVIGVGNAGLEEDVEKRNPKPIAFEQVPVRSKERKGVSVSLELNCTY